MASFWGSPGRTVLLALIFFTASCGYASEDAASDAAMEMARVKVAHRTEIIQWERTHKELRSKLARYSGDAGDNTCVGMAPSRELANKKCPVVRPAAAHNVDNDAPLGERLIGDAVARLKTHTQCSSAGAHSCAQMIGTVVSTGLRTVFDKNARQHKELSDKVRRLKQQCSKRGTGRKATPRGGARIQGKRQRLCTKQNLMRADLNTGMYIEVLYSRLRGLKHWGKFKPYPVCIPGRGCADMLKTFFPSDKKKRSQFMLKSDKIYLPGSYSSKHPPQGHTRAEANALDWVPCTGECLNPKTRQCRSKCVDGKYVHFYDNAVTRFSMLMAWHVLLYKSSVAASIACDSVPPPGKYWAAAHRRATTETHTWLGEHVQDGWWRKKRHHHVGTRRRRRWFNKIFHAVVNVGKKISKGVKRHVGGVVRNMKKLGVKLAMKLMRHFLRIIPRHLRNPVKKMIKKALNGDIKGAVKDLFMVGRKVVAQFLHGFVKILPKNLQNPVKKMINKMLAGQTKKALLVLTYSVAKSLVPIVLVNIFKIVAPEDKKCKSYCGMLSRQKGYHGPVMAYQWMCNMLVQKVLPKGQAAYVTAAPDQQGGHKLKWFNKTMQFYIMRAPIAWGKQHLPRFFKTPFHQGMLTGKDHLGRGDGIGAQCAASVNVSLSMCNTCCCDRGPLSGAVNLALVKGNQKRCGAWFTFVDLLFRTINAFFRGYLIADRNVYHCWTRKM